MKILFIEDDDFKFENISVFLEGHDIIRAKSYNKGMRMILDEKPDAIVLDMMFPVFEDEDSVGSSHERMKHDQGLYVLMEMRRKNINIPVMISSSSLINTNEFDNVLIYLRYDGSVDSKPIVDYFIELVQKEEESKGLRGFRV